MSAGRCQPRQARSHRIAVDPAKGLRRPDTIAPEIEPDVECSAQGLSGRSTPRQGTPHTADERDSMHQAIPSACLHDLARTNSDEGCGQFTSPSRVPCASSGFIVAAAALAFSLSVTHAWARAPEPACRHGLPGPPTVWLVPTDGVWGDPTRWSDGVPNPVTDAIFGADGAVRPFVVSIDEQHSLGSLIIANQRVVLDAGAFGWPTTIPAFTAYGLVSVVKADAISPALTLRHGVYHVGRIEVESDAPMVFSGLDAIVQVLGTGLDPMLVRDGDCSLSATKVNVASATLGARSSFGAGEGSFVSLTLENGASLVSNRRFRFGVDQGNCNASIGPGCVIESTSGILIGGDLDPWLDAPGSGSLLVDGGILRLASNDATLAVATQGTGSLTLRGDAHIDGNGCLYLAKYGGIGTTVIDGPVHIDAKVCGAAVYGVATLLVTGPETTVSCTKQFSLWGHGGLDATVRYGASILAPSVLLGGFDSSLTIEGPDSRVDAAAWSFGESVQDYAISLLNGASINANTITLVPECTLSSTIGPAGAGHVNADSIALAGRLEVRLDGVPPPAAGTYIPLLTATSMSGAFSSWTTPDAHGYPALLAIEANSLGLRFIDHVDSFTLTAPTALVAGFVDSLQATVTLDGVTYDVTPTVSFDISDPDVLAIGPDGVMAGFDAGTVSIVAHFGPLQATAQVSVSLGGPVMPVELVSGSFEHSANDGVPPVAPTAFRHSMSDDGRIVAFVSRASSLVEGDRNGAEDVFVRDLDSQQFERVSEGPAGQETMSAASMPILSRDARFALAQVYGQLTDESVPPNIALPYLRDRSLGTIELAVHAPDGTPPNGGLSPLSISDNGRFVLIHGYASNLVPGDSASIDSFVHDRWSQTTERVSIRPNGTPMTGTFGPLDMSADGRFVLLTALEFDGSTFRYRLFLRDRTVGATTALMPQIDASIADASLAPDGTALAFTADGVVLDEFDAPSSLQTYVLDLASGDVTAASRGPDG
jgi:hypothetical protein